MKKLRFILVAVLVLALCATILAACGNDNSGATETPDNQAEEPGNQTEEPGNQTEEPGTTDPTTPSNPSNPTNPTNPTNPSNPTNPTNPDQPSDPATEKAMTTSYKNGRDSFYQISGILLPEIVEVELSDGSSFSAEKKEAIFVVAVNDATYATFLQTLKTELAKIELSNNDRHWEQEGFGAFWEWDYEDGGRMHKVTIQVERNSRAGTVTIGYWFRDYYTLTLTAGEGGSVELEIGGRAQENNKAHVCYNTASDLYATAAAGYEFIGFYEGNTLLSAQNPLETYMIVKDATIEARFQKLEGYKAVKSALKTMSGIVLPDLENVTTKNTVIKPDAEGLRDEFNCDFTFASAEAAAQAFADFSAAIALVDGDAEESSESNAIWSKLYEDAVIPYRDDVMMFAGGTSVFLMWRKQPIAFYNVTVEGEGGTADIVYTGANYEDVRVQRHWEIVDAFGGRIVATPAQGYEFDGWYVDGERVSENADWRFRYSSESTDPVDFTEITFVAKFAAIEMTSTYSAARSAFQTASGILLPVLSTVSGMFEDLGANMYMVDINGATKDTLTSVITAFDDQTNSTSTIDGYGKNVWEYTISGKNAICELSAFYSDNIVVIMYEEKHISNSYAMAKDAFFGAIGVTLPAIADLDVSIYFGGTYMMFDIVGGNNLTHDTYEQFLSFFDELTGWTGEEDEHSTEYYPTYVYTNATSGVSFQAVWNGESESGGIYLNAFNTLSTFDQYAAAKRYIATFFEITMPEMENVTVGFSCDENATSMTFDLTKADNFTESEYNQFVSALSAKLGNGTDDSDEYQKRTMWTDGEKLWDVVWDMTTGLAVNFG